MLLVLQHCLQPMLYVGQILLYVIFHSGQELVSYSQVIDSVLEEIKHFFLKFLATEFLFLIFPSLPCFVCPEVGTGHKTIKKTQQMLFTMHR